INRERFVSALTHLVRNAQDATPPDGSVALCMCRGADELLITVEDNGHGMEAAFVRDRLFRPFDTTKGTKGMGIGAYQVRDLIRASGGDVEVSSAPGRGTTFSLRIPLAEPQTEPHPERERG